MEITIPAGVVNAALVMLGGFAGGFAAVFVVLWWSHRGS